MDFADSCFAMRASAIALPPVDLANITESEFVLVFVIAYLEFASSLCHLELAAQQVKKPLCNYRFEFGKVLVNDALEGD